MCVQKVSPNTLHICIHNILAMALYILHRFWKTISLLFCFQTKINRSNKVPLTDSFPTILQLEHLWMVSFQREQISHIWSPAHIHLAEQVVITCFLNEVMNMSFNR